MAGDNDEYIGMVVGGALVYELGGKSSNLFHFI